VAFHIDAVHCSVVPEVDGPSHAAAWGPGIPGMVANCSQWAYGDGTYYKALDKIALNPVVNVTYEVLVRAASLAVCLVTP